jgi:hypothetical protein
VVEVVLVTPAVGVGDGFETGVAGAADVMRLVEGIDILLILFNYRRDSHNLLIYCNQNL